MERLTRDGTILGPDKFEIDLRTDDGEVWVTLKGDPYKQERLEQLAMELVRLGRR